MPIAVIIIIALLAKFWWLLILIASIVIIPIINTIEKKSTEITKVSTKKMKKVRLDMSSTDIGYINKNNQKNIGRTDNP